MKIETLIVMLGYILVSDAICDIMNAGPIEQMFSVLGGAPIGWHCGKCDVKEG